MKSTVTEKGRVTIPKRIRDKLGLQPGQVLEFEARNGLLVGRKAEARSAVDAVVGILRRSGRPPIDVDAEITKMRGKPWNPKDDAPRAKRR
jgi:AbrB family looped-hinge helix DNA binding protein